MAKKSQTKNPRGRTRRNKFFNLEESDISSYLVRKRRQGYVLYGIPEIGRIGHPSSTIEDALSSEAIQYDCNTVGRAKIETNVHLEELFAILNSYAFSVLLHNADTLIINDAEIDVNSLKNVLVWYKNSRKNLTNSYWM